MISNKFSEVQNELLSLYRPMNKEEMCDFLKIKPHTLEYYNGAGLPRFKVGNEIRYCLTDVLNFFRSRGVEKERFADASEA